MDLCFELAMQIMARLKDAVCTADEVQGFRYFDERDVLGFVDGTENPTGDVAANAVFIGREDPAFAGGSYVIVQKYLHNLEAWNNLSTEAQEKIIGRSKVSDIELDDSVKPPSAHNALTVIEKNGKEVKILRDNMPFGSPGRGEFGTYFIGYSRSPRTIEDMLENMFIGDRPATMIASSTSALRSQETCSSYPRPRFSTVFPLNSLHLLCAPRRMPHRSRH